MNVVIITTQAEIYHQYLCAEIAKNHNVVAILHPKPKTYSRKQSRELRRNSIRRHGFISYLLKWIAANRFFKVGWDEAADLKLAQQRFFPNAQEDYREYAQGKARIVDDINSENSIALLESFKPDVVVCSGGPIYREQLIRACGLMLNFHTGISPLYNGSFTVYWTYANKQPHITGGTLMKMDASIDNGDILAHYLPSVEADDTPATLFMKSIMGGVSLYNRFLNELQHKKSFIALPQGKPFLYYQSHEWTVYQTVAIQRHIKNRICRDFARPELTFIYWNHSDHKSASDALKKNILSLIYNGDAKA